MYFNVHTQHFAMLCLHSFLNTSLLLHCFQHDAKHVNFVVWLPVRVTFLQLLTTTCFMLGTTPAAGNEDCFSSPCCLSRSKTCSCLESPEIIFFSDTPVWIECVPIHEFNIHRLPWLNEISLSCLVLYAFRWIWKHWKLPPVGGMNQTPAFRSFYA